MFCTNCGEKVVEPETTCPKCGTQIGKRKQEGGVSKGLLWAGYLCPIFLPFAGFLIGLVIGIILLTKGRTGHGIAQILISVTILIFILYQFYSRPMFY
jgi:uncharacterized membrane protein YvbJ